MPYVVPVVMPGTRTPKLLKDLPVGMVSMISRVMTAACCTFWTSTSGAAPETVIVSSRVPTANRPSTVTVAIPLSATSSRTKVLKPGKMKVAV